MKRFLIGGAILAAIALGGGVWYAIKTATDAALDVAKEILVPEHPQLITLPLNGDYRKGKVVIHLSQDEDTENKCLWISTELGSAEMGHCGPSVESPSHR